jgi:hypothetical protein
MSRGLSQQQHQILGIAAHVNRLTQDGTLAVKTGVPVPRYPEPSVDYRGVKDLQWPLAAHLLHGLPFVEAHTTIKKSNGIVQTAGNFFDLRSRPAKSIKASVLRAITGLVRTGHLVCAPNDEPLRWGYVLTEAGLAVGRQSEVPFAPALIFRAGLLVFPDQIAFLFYPIYAALCLGTLTMPDLLTALTAFLPQQKTRQVWRTFAHAVLGEEGLRALPGTW